MILDHYASDPVFTTGPLPAVDLDEMVEWTRGQLGLGPDRPWKLVSARRKLGKPLFEVEDETGERIIGKVARPSRGETLFKALHMLWDAGFRPPHEFTVVRPIAWFPERDLLLQERAPGLELMHKITQQSADADESTRRTAQWLAALHRCEGLDAQRWHESPDRWIDWSTQLQQKAPWAAERIAALERACREFLASRGDDDLVPCHGDFHPMNMFIADDGRLTAIDIDKFGVRERVDEVGYCLGQTAFMCYMRMNTIEGTRDLRRLFLDEYERASGTSLNHQALGGFMAATVIKNLHFTLVAYQERTAEMVDPWLDAANHWLAGRIFEV